MLPVEPFDIYCCEVGVTCAPGEEGGLRWAGEHWPTPGSGRAGRGPGSLCATAVPAPWPAPPLCWGPGGPGSGRSVTHKSVTGIECNLGEAAALPHPNTLAGRSRPPRAPLRQVGRDSPGGGHTSLPCALDQSVCPGSITSCWLCR